MSSRVDQAVREYADGLAPAVAELARSAAARLPGLAQRMTGAGLDHRSLAPGELSSLPVLSKDEVIALQSGSPPFGGLLADGAPLERMFQSPGPIYEPQLAGADPWRWAPALAAAGIGADDRVLNCFSYHLSPAGAMFELGCLAVGASVLPGGIGNQDLQARAIADLGVTAYTGLPSYLKSIMDRWAEAGLPWDRWRLRRALVTAEPLPDSLRSVLMERVERVLMAYGTAEVGLIGYETAPGSGLRLADGLLVEVCDLDTGEPVTHGEGQVVVTLLRPDYPLVRFGTGDLSAWTVDDEGHPRLAGVVGRVGEAVKVRGMFLHPRQAAAALTGCPGLGTWRLLVDRLDHRDELTCEVVPSQGVDPDTLRIDVGGRIRDGLRFAAKVVAVDAIDDGAGRLIDRRSWD